MQKNYYAIIPANVRYDKDLPPNAKLLYGEITALCNEKGYCWAGNTYFSELYGVNKVTISRWISQLTSKGYISSEIQYKEGTKQIVNRYIRICNDPINENVNTPINKIVKDNNTVINNTSNNTKEYIPFSEIVSYLNEKTNSNYKSTSKKTKELITARWNDGFTLDNFKMVIDNKAVQWLNDTKMSEYLRPETLFGTKFESYLNQKGAKKIGSSKSNYEGYNFDREKELKF